jgi:hypothetical protein
MEQFASLLLWPNKERGKLWINNNYLMLHSLSLVRLEDGG